MAKHKIKNLIFVLDGYPYNGGNSCVFVRNLIVAIADMGTNCTVITPQIMTPGMIKKRGIPYQHKDVTQNGYEINVYAPMYVYYPANLGLTKSSMDHHYHAVLRTIQKEGIKADAIYGHFVFQCGLTAARVGSKLGIPSFLGAGESDKLIPGNHRNHGVYEMGVKKLNWQKYLGQLRGIICVAEYTKQLLFQYGFLSAEQEEKTVVYPNGVNQEIFHPADKKAARKKLGLPEDDFILLFVGAFNENKGVLRVAEAVNRVSRAKVVFLGNGALAPECEGMLFCDSCDNKKVATYMQAADSFILPTRSEGCCNAILEALSCGLPVISSDLPFNDGVLDKSNSVRINPNNIDEIVNAIRALLDHPNYQKKLAKGAIVSSSDLGIEKRAEKVIRFMSEVADKCC